MPGLLLAGAALAGCAREEPPPGHGPDLAPPRAVRVEPEPGAVLPGFDGSVRFRFDEPLADARTLEREIFTSPAWRWRFEPGRSDVRLRPADGWRDGVVWFIRVPAGVPDLLGNRTPEPIELLFSTGPPVTSTRADGRLSDRVTGRPVTGGRVLFLAEDTVPYTAVSDTAGRFSLPGLPPGRYRAIGFLDRNGNLRPDRGLEPHDSAEVFLETQASEVTIALRLVEPDTTPPVLTGAAASDSATLRLEFDDPLEPDPGPAAVVEVRDEASGRAWPVAEVSVGDGPRPGEAEEAPPGAEEGEPEPQEPVAEEPVPEAPPGEAPEGVAVEEAPVAEPLPARRVTVRLVEPLVPGSYRVRASGFRNLRGLEGGGDTTLVFPSVPEPGEPEEGAEIGGEAPDAEAGGHPPEEVAEEEGRDGEGEPP